MLFFFSSLYRGKVGLDVAEAQHLMDGLDWQGAVKDIRASVNWLKANGSKKVFHCSPVFSMENYLFNNILSSTKLCFIWIYNLDLRSGSILKSSLFFFTEN